jgi:hypothetical protein
MSMRKGSRYEGLKLFSYHDEKGRKRTVLDIRPPIPIDAVGSNAKRHIKKRENGEYLDTLAILKGANREELWYVIADINSIERPLNIPRNSLLFIPNVVDFLRF